MLEKYTLLTTNFSLLWGKKIIEQIYSPELITDHMSPKVT